MMWDPVRFLESCPSSDGACAVVFTDEAGGDAAAADGRPPAWILGSAVRSEPSSFPGRDPVRPQGAVDCAADVYAQAGITDPLEQIDCAELYVPFSWYEPMWLEAHDIAAPTEGWKMVERGDTALDGSFPVNMSGGVLSSNPIGASGLLRFAEAALQVRGMAGEHQVDGAKVRAGPGLRRVGAVLLDVGRRQLARPVLELIAPPASHPAKLRLRFAQFHGSPLASMPPDQQAACERTGSRAGRSRWTTKRAACSRRKSVRVTCWSTWVGDC